jgi:hypothetical protein
MRRPVRVAALASQSVNGLRCGVLFLKSKQLSTKAVYTKKLSRITARGIFTFYD